MRNPIRVLLAGTLLLSALPGCRKVDFGPDEGYSQRDSSNYPGAQLDDTDWTSDKDWKKVEKQLFNGLGVDLDQSQTGGVGQLSLYPNPVVEMAAFIVEPGTRNSPNTAPALKIKAIIVDKKYRKLQEFDLPTLGGNNGTRFTLRLDRSKLAADQLYRMYYVFYDDANKQLYLKGHGDIKVVD
jgi:hypothetical protein